MLAINWQLKLTACLPVDRLTNAPLAPIASGTSATTHLIISSIINLTLDRNP
jgi:hypothetical protein